MKIINMKLCKKDDFPAPHLTPNSNSPLGERFPKINADIKNLFAIFREAILCDKSLYGGQNRMTKKSQFLILD